RNCSSLITLRHSWSSKPGHAPQPARHLDSVLSGYRLATSRPCIILYRGIRNADATPILVDFSTPNPSAILSLLVCARLLWTLASLLLLGHQRADAGWDRLSNCCITLLSQ